MKTYQYWLEKLNLENLKNLTVNELLNLQDFLTTKANQVNSELKRRLSRKYYRIERKRSNR